MTETKAVSTTKDAVILAKIERVLALVGSGTVGTIKEALARVEVPKSTYYSWLQRPEIQQLFAGKRAAMSAEIVSQIEAALPQVVKILCDDAQNKKLPARDREAARRTLRLYLQDVSDNLPEPAGDGSDAARWLSENKDRFRVTAREIVIESGRKDYTPVRGTIEGDIVEGQWKPEAEEPIDGQSQGHDPEGKNGQA